MDEYFDSKEQSEQRWRQHRFDMIRNIHLKRNYGLTLTQYNEKLKRQKFGCEICGSKNAKGRGRNNTFNVDHNHKTGKTRGIVCRPCNTILIPAIEYYGQFVSKTRKYLKKYDGNP